MFVWSNSADKNSDIDKYEYACCGIGFDSKGTFSHASETTGQNVIIFGAILILDEGFTQGLEDTTLYAEKMYSINFTATRTKLGLHYNGDNSYLFANGTEIIKFKAKGSEIIANPLYLGNISEDFSVANMKKIGLHGSVSDFSAD